MTKYTLPWEIVEGSLKIERINTLNDCIEKNHLLQIREMLTNEGFESDKFFVSEYPTDGVYICCRENAEDFFSIDEIEGKLIPHFTTKKSADEGNTHFPCESIRRSIELMEC